MEQGIIDPGLLGLIIACVLVAVIYITRPKDDNE